MIKDALNDALSCSYFDFSSVLSRVEMPFASIPEPRIFSFRFGKSYLRRALSNLLGQIVERRHRYKHLKQLLLTKISFNVR